MTHQPHHLPLRWTHAEGVWLAKGPDHTFTVTRAPDCLKRCWVLTLREWDVGSFRTLRAAKEVAEAIERG